MTSAALQAAGAQGASRRAARMARELNATVAQVAAQLDADLVASIELPYRADARSLAALSDLVAEATQTGEVVVSITRPSTATTAP